MSYPDAILPVAPGAPSAGTPAGRTPAGALDDANDELVLEGRAMATTITLRVPVPGRTPPERRARLEAAARDALSVFSDVEAACTRFDPSSPLMRANRSPDRWHRVPPVLLQAIGEAKRAYDATGGRMDPRVLRHLVALGYDRTLPFGHGVVRVEPARCPRPGSAGHGGHPSGTARPTGTPRRPGAWRPRLRFGTSEVLIGADPIDLGGIGKGLAVRWAGARLSAATADYLLDAGGDCACAGRAPGGGPWLVGVEDPSPSAGSARGAGPVAVLALSDRAVTTSSIRLRRWISGGREVHHLIDPRNGRPGGDGLLSVTVVGPDPATAEAWSKALFLAGRSSIGRLAHRRRLAALWIDDRLRLAHTEAMARYVRWQRT